MLKSRAARPACQTTSVLLPECPNEVLSESFFCTFDVSQACKCTGQG